MLTVVFGQSTMSRTQVQLWYKQFKEGANIETVKKMILDNRRITIMLIYHSAHAKQIVRLF